MVSTMLLGNAAREGRYIEFSCEACLVGHRFCGVRQLFQKISFGPLIVKRTVQFQPYDFTDGFH